MEAKKSVNYVDSIPSNVSVKRVVYHVSLSPPWTYPPSLTTTQLAFNISALLLVHVYISQNCASLFVTKFGQFLLFLGCATRTTIIMNALFTQYGIDRYVWVHRARLVVMRENTTWNTCLQSSQCQTNFISDKCKLTKAITNLLMDHYDYDYPSDMEDYDDDECSSCSMEGTTSCSSDESHNNGNRVSFCSPLVTATYVRPTTTSREKLELYYSEMDYREFRRNYLVLNRIQASRLEQTRHKSVVQIHPQVVTETHTIPSHEDPTDLYYSQADLQGYVRRILPATWREFCHSMFCCFVCLDFWMISSVRW